MILKAGFLLSLFLSIFHPSVVKSTREGTLECMRIQGTDQWAVYLKCSGTNREFCWHGCVLSKSFYNAVYVPKDCICNQAEEKRKKRFSFLNRKTIIIPEECFNPNGLYPYWFRKCILEQRSSMESVAVIKILNEVLRSGKSLWDTRSFFSTLERKLKPVVIQIFRGKSTDEVLETKINKYFKRTMYKFSCDIMVNSQQTVILYNAILNVVSKTEANEFASTLKENPCILNENTLYGQRFAVAPSKTSQNIINQITREWKENHNIAYVQVYHKSAREVLAWKVGSTKESETLSNIIVKDIHDYFLSTSDDDSRAFIDIQGKTKYCISEFGCLPMSVPYTELMEHPKSKLPESLHTISPHLWRYSTFNDQSFKETLNAAESCLIGEKKMLFLVIHGFRNSGNEAWVQQMKDALLKRADNAMVIVVDWEEGAAGLFQYYQAAVNTYAVGSIVAYALQKYFVKQGCISVDDVHIIGHSLGAQTAGFVGDSFYHSTNDHIGKITGLDPAGPWFEDKEAYLRLDETDAKYVQVLHTSARSEGGEDETHSPLKAVGSGEYGVRNPVGHIDFYFNGGHDQPGCSNIGDKFSCSHSRAHKYFSESINSQCKFIGFRCSGETRGEQFENCFLGNHDLNSRAVMGLGEGNKRDEGLFFVSTTSNDNSFCNETISLMYPTSR